jgi:hypothetical protein
MRKSLVVTGVVLVLPAHADAQAPIVRAGPVDVESVLVEAAALHKESADEQASAVLRDAMATLASRPDTAARAKQRERITERLLDLDPRAGDRRAADLDVAARLIAIADVYRKKRWYRVALHFVREAGRYDDAAAREPLARLRRMSPRTFKNPIPESEFTVADPNARPDWHEFQARDLFQSGWSLAPDLITSPARKSVDAMTYALCSDPAHTDGVVSVEVRRTSENGDVGVIFGWANEKDFFLFVVEGGMNQQYARLFRYLDEKWQNLGAAKCSIPKQKRLDWLRQGVRIEGKQVELQVGEETVLRADCSRVPHGKLALLVAGRGGAMEPVSFRRPRFSPLIVKKKEDPKAVEDRARHRNLCSRLDTATKALRRQKELALLHVLRVRRDADGLYRPSFRRMVFDTARDIGVRAWRKQAEVDEDLAATAGVLLRLARAYHAAGWHRTAAAIVGRAARLDDASVAETRAKLAVDAAKKTPDSQATEAVSQGRPDNAIFKKWFVKGRRFQGKPWKFSEDCVESNVDSVSEQLIASTGELGTSGKFRLQVKAGDKPAFFGVVVGFKGWYRHHVLTIAHSYTTTELAFKRKVDGEFTHQVGAKRTTKFSAAARKKWMTIEIEFDGNRLIATVGEERLEFPIGKEDLSGNIGLYHRVGYKGEPIRFRNLVIEKGERSKKPGRRGR